MYSFRDLLAPLHKNKVKKNDNKKKNCFKYSKVLLLVIIFPLFLWGGASISLQPNSLLSFFFFWPCSYRVVIANPENYTCCCTRTPIIVYSWKMGGYHRCGQYHKYTVNLHVWSFNFFQPGNLLSIFPIGCCKWKVRSAIITSVSSTVTVMPRITTLLQTSHTYNKSLQVRK